MIGKCSCILAYTSAIYQTYMGVAISDQLSGGEVRNLANGVGEGKHIWEWLSAISCQEARLETSPAVNESEYFYV